MQRGTRRERLSEKREWSWLLIRVHCWSRNVLVAAEAVDVPSEVAAPEERAEQAAPVAEAALAGRVAALVEPGGQAELAAAEERAEQAVLAGQEAGAEQVERAEELLGEVGAAYPTRI